MPRQIGLSAPVEAVNEAVKAGRTPLLDLTIAVVTPLFGGGYDPGQTDADLPIHPASIRGHLRFWWRACHAHRYPSAETLFHDEAHLWGQSHGDGLAHAPSAIDIEVCDLKTGVESWCVKWTCRWRDGRLRWHADWGDPPLPSYALFPFQGETPDECMDQELWEEPPAKMRRKVEFRLRVFQAVSLDRSRKAIISREVEDAVWAWLTFGGIGARTRRGCGTLLCTKVHAPTDPPGAIDTFRPTADPVAWLIKRAKDVLQGAPVAPRLPIPLLKDAWLVPHPSWQEAPEDAWASAVALLQKLRQGKNVGRRPGNDPNNARKLGQSYWPEADAVRRYFGSNKRGHNPRHPGREYFPRGEFGLPLIIQFNVDQQYGDPIPHTLMPPEDIGDRMASPVIVKALALSPTIAVPMVVCLNTPLLRDLDDTGVSKPLRLKSDRAVHTVHLPDQVADGTTAMTIDKARTAADPWQGGRSALDTLARFAASPSGWSATKIVLGQ